MHDAGASLTGLPHSAWEPGTRTPTSSHALRGNSVPTRLRLALYIPQIYKPISVRSTINIHICDTGLITRIKQRDPQAKILVFSMHQTIKQSHQQHHD